jgi:hypothetical protein
MQGEEDFSLRSKRQHDLNINEKWWRLLFHHFTIKAA